MDGGILRSLVTAALCALALSACNSPEASSGPEGPLVFNQANSGQPASESIRYNLAIVWRPGSGDTVRINPPRFSWPYEPTIMLPPGCEQQKVLPVRHYRFQIAADSV